MARDDTKRGAAGATSARSKLRTLAVSPDFADLITELARERGLTVQEYCDRHGAPKFAGDYDRLAKAKAAKAAALCRRGS